MWQHPLSGVVSFASYSEKVTKDDRKLRVFSLIKNNITMLILKQNIFNCEKGLTLEMLLSFDHVVVWLLC